MESTKWLYTIWVHFTQTSNSKVKLRYCKENIAVKTQYQLYNHLQCVFVSILLDHSGLKPKWDAKDIYNVTFINYKVLVENSQKLDL